MKRESVFPRRLWLVGASVRAAAESARSAGFSVWASDLFGDRDLRGTVDRFIPIRRAADLVRVGESLPSTDFVFTGALENHSRVITHLLKRHRLLGCSPRAIDTLRSPRRWPEILQHAGVPVLTHVFAPRSIDKPFRSGGGIGVRVAREKSPRPGRFFQERLGGQSWGTTIAADGRSVELLGVTKQWIGCQGGARAFSYCGSIGPVEVPREWTVRLQRAASALVAATGARGVLGIDWVDDGRTWWVVEINPRYPASAEVLEMASRRSVMAAHVRASLWTSGDGFKPWPADSACIAAKVICYAPAGMSGSAFEPIRSDVEQTFDVKVADIPTETSRIRAGTPLATLLATDTDAARLEARMTQAATAMRKLILRASKCD